MMENIIFRIVSEDKKKITELLTGSMTIQKLYETFNYKILKLIDRGDFDISKLVFGDYSIRISSQKKEKNYPKEVEIIYDFFIWANQSDEDLNKNKIKYGVYKPREELIWSNFVSAKPSKSWYHWIDKILKKEQNKGGINRVKMVILFLADETNNYLLTRNKDGEFYFRVESTRSLYEKYDKALDKMNSCGLMDYYKKQLIDLEKVSKNE